MPPSERGGIAGQQLRSLMRSSLETVNRHPHAAEIYQGDYGYLQTLPHFDYLKTVAGEVQKAWLDVITAGVAIGEFRTTSTRGSSTG